MKWNQFVRPTLAAAAALPWTPPLLGAFTPVAAAEEGSCPAGDPGCADPPRRTVVRPPEGRRADAGHDDSSSDDPSDDSGDSSGDPSGDSLDPSGDSSSDDGPGEGGFGNPNAHVDEDADHDANRVSCVEYIDLSGHRYFQETMSFYQEMGWSERHRGVGRHDVCLSLDDIVQICSSYRPHYHEPFVHFPAAYLEEMKRVAFIGGGDAMLLQEALKYPDLELVLGLELDQKVVRESLRHFHTRPHFDDPRVQWWFGDAAKSLTLLPREWFGTFDLVMVDLSETGMSISVNDDLDIFGALALLLKPDGVMVKNEDYFSQMSKYFDYSISVYMDKNPLLCDQDWAMGSNKADFLRPRIDPSEENAVPTLEYLPYDEDYHYRMLIDYARNDARQQGQCDDYDAALNGEKPKEAAKPAASSGILLVADADRTTKALELDSFLASLEASGMTPLESSLFLPSGEGVTPSLFIGMEEGYVSAQLYPGTSSVGIEILLWSKLGKQNDILRSLLDVVGVEKSYSSYRVIHGGMNGHQNWKEEMDTKGPVKKTLRDCAKEAKAFDPKESSTLSMEVYSVVLAESMSLLTKKDHKAVAVLCGTKGVHKCAALDSLKDNEKVHALVAIWTCPGASRPDDGMDAEEDGLSHVYACSDNDIARSAKSEEGYSALVVDPAAPDGLVGIGEKIFCNDRILRSRRHPYLRDRVVFVGPLSSDAERSLFSRCNLRISKHLPRSGTVVVDGAAGVGIISSKNDGFVPQLVSLTERVEKKTGLPTEIDKMKSGPVPFQDDFDPLHHSADAYDQLDAMKQYTHQMPLASQSIYRLEVGREDETGKLSRSSAKEVLDFAIGESQHFVKSKRSYFEVGDGSIAAALDSAGHVVVTWNGAATFTINMLTDGENYGKQYHGDEERMVLLNHDDFVGRMKGKLPASTVVASREHMPRGANRVVNFKYDITATPGCADHYELCKDFANEGKCDKKKHQPWMHQYCALSCDACDEMVKTMQ